MRVLKLFWGAKVLMHHTENLAPPALGSNKRLFPKAFSIHLIINLLKLHITYCKCDVKHMWCDVVPWPVDVKYKHHLQTQMSFWDEKISMPSPAITEKTLCH